jgi:hypothetical protein
MAVLSLVRWALLAVGVAAVAAQIALKQSQQLVGGTVLATALLYWIVSQIQDRRG